MGQGLALGVEVEGRVQGAAKAQENLRGLIGAPIAVIEVVRLR